MKTLIAIPSRGRNHINNFNWCRNNKDSYLFVQKEEFDLYNFPRKIGLEKEGLVNCFKEVSKFIKDNGYDNVFYCDDDIIIHNYEHIKRDVDKIFRNESIGAVTLTNKEIKWSSLNNPIQSCAFIRPEYLPDLDAIGIFFDEIITANIMYHEKFILEYGLADIERNTFNYGGIHENKITDSDIQKERNWINNKMSQTKRLKYIINF